MNQNSYKVFFFCIIIPSFYPGDVPVFVPSLQPSVSENDNNITTTTSNFPEDVTTTTMDTITQEATDQSNEIVSDDLEEHKKLIDTSVEATMSNEYSETTSDDNNEKSVSILDKNVKTITTVNVTSHEEVQEEVKAKDSIVEATNTGNGDKREQNICKCHSDFIFYCYIIA